MGDIEIARSVTLQPIEEIAKIVGIEKDDLECYGKYKAKISNEVYKKLEQKTLHH
jgi:formate--tetrahydrofolate ligase